MESSVVSNREAQVQSARNHRRTAFVLMLSFVAAPGFVRAQSPSGTPSAGAPQTRDGRGDFDIHIGTWRTHLRRLLRPLTGSTTWVEYEGTTVVRKVWDGKANLVELVVDGKAGAGHIEALSLRLYNPDTHQWSLNFSNSASGTMATPTIGEFRNGRGEFYDQELLNGRAIFVRFLILPITADSIRFEQSFSADGGKTWEPNWIALDTRVKGGDGAASSGRP